jgi:hypothetical protein
MRTLDFVPVLLAVALVGCSSRNPAPGPSGDIVVVDDDAGYVTEARGPGHIPPGHYPPPGECRIWHAGRPPGHQPPPVPCERLYGTVPFGAFVLYDSRAWDSRYDWRRHERRHPDSVPRMIFRLLDGDGN